MQLATFNTPNTSGTIAGPYILNKFGQGTTAVEVEYTQEGLSGGFVTVVKKIVNAVEEFAFYDTTETVTTKSKWYKWPGVEVVADGWEPVANNTTATGWKVTYKQYRGVDWDSSSYMYSPPPKPLEDRLAEIIRTRCAPDIIGERKGVGHTDDMREVRARETLRRVLGDSKFQMFLKKGFVTVQARSGLIYQIDSGHITKVWDGGRLVDRLCIYLQGGFPPTDSVIIKYLLVLNNEDQYRSLAIKQSVTQPLPRSPRVEVPPPSLVDLFNDLKKTHTLRRRKVAA